MVSLPLRQCWSAVGFFVGLLVFLVSTASAQDDSTAKRQLAFMQAEVRNLEAETSEPKTKEALRLVAKPLLRYSDPTRGGVEDKANVLLDAGVWRLGTEGRPTALVTVEIYQAANKSRILAFEFLSLSDAKFTLKHKNERVRWDPSGSALTFKELPESPRPAASSAARLVQMRRLARRFTAKERIKKEAIDCRLLTQPIDRYHSEADKIVDGAIFVYANSTNPELGVVLETDGEHWRYGVLRLTGAISSLLLDGREVAAYEHFDSRRRTDGPYHSDSYAIGREK